MQIRRNASNVNAETSPYFWVLVAVTGVALIAAALTFPRVSVLADALLSKPATAPASPALSPTPALEEAGKAKKYSLDPMLKGIASWYGPHFDGRLTASGERFDMYAMTACHPTLPFGTVVRVKNLENLRTVVVRITDRGDLMPGRVIDLSYEAAAKLHMVQEGLAPVTIEVLKDGKSGSAHN